MTDRNIPYNNYEIDEAYDYWDRCGRSDEYRFSSIVNPEKIPDRKPEIDDGEDIPDFGIRYRF